MSRISLEFEQLVRTQGVELPLPGQGKTWQRFETLSAWAAKDLSLGRLAEGHVDALAILAEAGLEVAEPMATYGVWAARSGSAVMTARRESGGWRLSGEKAFCSGGTLMDRALVSAESADGYRLFDVAVSEQVIRALPDSWVAVGMADSFSETLEFGGPPVPNGREVGAPGFYLERPGFWFGAVGVAACWFGGAAGLVEHLLKALEPASPDLVLGALGEAVAHVQGMRHVLQDAAREIDADPEDMQGTARRRALVVRHAVHHAASEVLVLVAAAGGARPLCHDREQAQRAADLYVYLAQHHGPQEAAALGRLLLDGGAWN
jgi:alkylation response protein AidB-like acyl-CoA dehydrogenase